MGQKQALAFERELDLDRFIVDPKVENLNYKLSLCGRMASKTFYCKKCDSENRSTVLKHISRKKFSCEIHYCPEPDCIVQRFARQKNTFDEIKRLDGLSKLWHFVISFEAIPLHEFRSDFHKIRKRHQAVLNKYFEKLKAKGLKIEALRVLDFSFEKDMKVLPHYHFGAIPKASNQYRSHLVTMQDVRKSMMANMRIKTPFHFQSFGMKNKQGVLSYLSKRSAGLYTWKESKSAEYIPSSKGKLMKDILNKKYFTLHDVLTSKEYIKSFYNRTHFQTIGGLSRPVRHGSILTEDIPNLCPIHGHLEPSDVRMEIEFLDETSKPPNLIKTYPELVIEVQKI